MKSSLLRIIVPFGLGYFLSYLFRVVNAVIADEMSKDVGLDAYTLGLMTSVYFATFAAFQIPLGLLLDRFGPRRVESLLLLFAAAGALIFATTTSISGLVIGRGLIGLGVSSCLMAAFTAYRRWFSVDRLPLINGLQMAFGGLGALAGTRPSAMVMEVSGWRTLFIALAMLAVLVSLIIWFVVPRKDPVSSEPASHSSGGLRDILADRLFWSFAPFVVFSQAAFLSVQTLWIGTWLRDVAGMGVIEASNVMALTTLSMVAGFLFLGWCASYLARRGVSFLTTATVGMVLYLIPQLALIAGGLSAPTAVWMLYGFLGTTSIIGFSAISRHFPVQITGRANTTLNFMIFVMAFIGQWGLGVVINQFPAQGGYDPEGYRAALAIAFALQLISLIWFAASSRRRQF